MNTELPAPVVNADSAPYWEGARGERLLLQRCGDCGAVRFFPRHLCTECGSDSVEWVEASGRGTVHSFTNPAAASDGARYHERSSRRAFAAMEFLLDSAWN